MAEVRLDDGTPVVCEVCREPLVYVDLSFRSEFGSHSAVGVECLCCGCVEAPVEDGEDVGQLLSAAA